jgi:hypothetical protein
MKSPVLIIIALMATQVVHAQVIQVTFKEIHTFEHPSDISLYQAEREGVLEFLSFETVNSMDVIDLNNNTYTRLTNGEVTYSAPITENIKDGNVCTIRIGNSLFILSNNIENGEYVFIAEYQGARKPGFTYGELSMGNQLEVKMEE